MPGGVDGNNIRFHYKLPTLLCYKLVVWWYSNRSLINSA